MEFDNIATGAAFSASTDRLSSVLQIQADGLEQLDGST